MVLKRLSQHVRAWHNAMCMEALAEVKFLTASYHALDSDASMLIEKAMAEESLSKSLEASIARQEQEMEVRETLILIL